MKKCKSDEISLKSYFLGPQAENSSFLQSSALDVINQYCQWRKSLFPQDGKAISKGDQLDPGFLKNQQNLQQLLLSLSLEFEKELPQFSPRYLGHMFSELSMPGLLGHLVALLHNPNNISKESSQVGLKIEREALESLCRMFGWKSGIGHLTSGGTIANLEALVRMRSRLPQEQWGHFQLVTSAAAHYSWKKNMKILGLPESAVIEVPLDSAGRISLTELEKLLRDLKSPIVGVVSLFGSTERGTIDDIAGINRILRKLPAQRFWHHVDAAYGGFFACVRDPKNTYLSRQTEALRQIDSLTLDPHKLGYAPYGCGTFLCRQKKDYFYNQIDAPYIQFKSDEEAGVQSIEGSRPATGAAATWLTTHTLGFHSKGLGKVLARQVKVKKEFQKKLQKRVNALFFPEGLDLNILCWTLLPKSRNLSGANDMVDLIFHKLPQLEAPYYVSKTSLKLMKNPWLESELRKRKFKIDSDTCHFVRMTLMNPFLMTRETETRFVDDFIQVLNSISETRLPKRKRP